MSYSAVVTDGVLGCHKLVKGTDSMLTTEISKHWFNFPPFPLQAGHFDKSGGKLFSHSLPKSINSFLQAFYNVTHTHKHTL